MASNSAHNLTITARAVDNASGPIRGLAKEFDKLPQTLGKASSALSQLEAANSDLGKTVGGVLARSADLVRMFANSGPLGIAIAATSAAVAAGTRIWEVYQERITAVESASKSLSEVINKQSQGATLLMDDVRALDARIAAFGKTADQAALAQAKIDFETKSKGAKDLAREIAVAEEKNRNLTQSLRERSAAQVQLAGTAEGYKNLNIIGQLEDEIRLNKLSLDGLRQSKTAIDAQSGAESLRIERLSKLNTMQETAKTQERAREQYIKNTTEATKQHSAALKAAIDRINEYTEAAKMALADDLRGVDQLSKTRIGAIEIEADNFEKNAKLRDQVEQQSLETTRKEEERRRFMYQQTAALLVNSFGDAFGSMINGSKSADRAFGDMFANLGKMVLAQAATYVVAKGIETAANLAAGETKVAVDTSTAASGAMSAHSNIPFVGIAIGLAAAAAIIAAILAFKKFSKGGLVTGGEQGRDSVPALLEPGEVVLPVSVVQSISRIMGKSPSARSPGVPGGVAMATGGMVPQSLPSRGNTTINVTAQLLDASEDQMKALGKKLGKVMADLQRNGHINLVPVT